MRLLDRGALLAAVVGVAVTARGDEARVRVSASLAERIEVGARSGLLVGLESDDGWAVATVSQSVRPVLLGTGDPEGALSPRPVEENLEVARGFALPAGLARLASRRLSPYETVVEVVRFVTLSVRLDEHDQGPQDAGTVLARGRGRCSGRANAAVGVLRALGLPARVVHGVLLDSASARWHRWGEVWLEEAGWVPFDAGASVGLVSVRYIPARGAGDGVSLLGTRLDRVDEKGYMSLPRRGPLRILPWQGVTLSCSVPAGAGEVTAVLMGPDGVRQSLRGRSEVVFRDLLPGLYTLGWRTDEIRVRSVPVDLRGQTDVRLSLGGRGEAGQ